MSPLRAELHELVDELPEQYVATVVEEVQQRIRPSRVVNAHPFAWVAAGPANNGRDDNAMRVDELLAAGFGR